MGLQLCSLHPRCFFLQSCVCKKLPLRAAKVLWGDLGKNPVHARLSGCSGRTGAGEEGKRGVQQPKKRGKKVGAGEAFMGVPRAAGRGEPSQGTCRGRAPLSCSLAEEQQPCMQTHWLGCPALLRLPHGSGSLRAQPRPRSPSGAGAARQRARAKCQTLGSR